MRRGLKLLDRLIERVLFLALAMMVVVVSLNVLLRYALHASLSWGDEVPQILLVWITFLGAAQAIRKHQQFEFDLVSRILPKGISVQLRVGKQLIVILVSVALVYWSAEVTLQIRGWTMPATGISRAWVYAACPVGCCAILVYAVQDLFDALYGRREEPAGEEKHL